MIFKNGTAKFDVETRTVNGEFEYEINCIEPASDEYPLDIDDIPTDHDAMEQLIIQNIIEQNS